MRTIDKIIVHCSATKEGVNFTARDIDRWHRNQGWSCIGYHYVVDIDGTLERGRPIEKVGAHCKNHNKTSIGVCYIGGLDKSGKPTDTRTPAQKKTLRELLENLVSRFNCPIYGHRDFARKECPCFDAHKEYRDIYRQFLCQQAAQIDEVFLQEKQS